VSDLFDIRGRTALITGANAGIGFGFADALASQGANVMIWSRRKDKNEAAAERLSAHGVRALHDEVDVSDEAQQVAAFERAVEEFGRIDCVIANAGIIGNAPFADMSFDDYQRLIGINQHGAFLTLREGVKHMVKTVEDGGPPGSLIATGSLSIFGGVPGMAHYGAAKGAVASMIKSIATEYGPLGIRANMICAGTVVNEGMEPLPDELLDVIGGKCPMGRIGRPEDLAGIVVYLMSDASRWHTGDLITVDGGHMGAVFPTGMPV